MKGGLFKALASIAFLFTMIFITNTHGYVTTLRVGIFPYHFMMTGAITFLLIALLAGSLRSLPRANALLIGWFLLLNLLMLLSLLLISSIKPSQDVFSSVALFSFIAIAFTMMVKDPRILKTCGIAVAASAFILAIVSFVEFFNPDFNIMDDVMFDSLGTEGAIQRVGGLYENPNANGYAMALSMFIGQYFLPRNLRFAFAISVGLAVLTTVSRSAILLWTLVTFMSIWTGAYSKSRIIPKIFAVIFTTGLATLLLTGQIPVIIEATGLDSLTSEKMMVRLSGDFLSQGDGSTESRKDLVSENFEIFASNPIFGIGLGGSKAAEFNVQLGSHNMLLRMGVELGALGILVYLSLLLVPLLAKSPQGMMFVLFYFFTNLFTHTSYEKPIFAVLIPIAVLHFSTANPQKVASRQNRRKRRRRKNRGHTENR